ncbi:MAG: glycosyltransferase family 2 protein [Pyrinomonadaceae bacterium]
MAERERAVTLNMLEQITPLILTYNEAPNIGRVLERLEWARDIVVVDSFSDDHTLQIVSAFSQARVFQRKFDSHERQWNFGLKETGISTEWVMALDADFILPPEALEEIQHLHPAKDISGFRAPLTFYVSGRKLRSAICPPLTFLYRRLNAEYLIDGHTQKLRVNGGVDTLRNSIIHDDRKSLARWFSSQKRYQQLEARKILSTPRSQLDFADRVRRLRVIAPMAILFYCLIIRGGLLDGWPGIFYASQRMFTEVLLALYLIGHDLKVIGKRPATAAGANEPDKRSDKSPVTVGKQPDAVG